MIAAIGSFGSHGGIAQHDPAKKASFVFGTNNNSSQVQFIDAFILFPLVLRYG